MTGQPAISIPIPHDDATGLPVGVQIVAGAEWREDLLLQVSRTLELAHPWIDRRRPSVEQGGGQSVGDRPRLLPLGQCLERVAGRSRTRCERRG